MTTTVDANQSLARQPRPLTKSRFKLALECPTKLYYAANRDYRDRSQGDAFLQALADGGHQVGALAKFKYHPDPLKAGITVEARGYDEAIYETQRRLAQTGRVVIAEAALSHQNYFVRVDILIRDPASETIEIIEVKSKGVKAEDIANRLKGAAWSPYLYDLAFQTEVAEMNFPNWRVVPKLLLIDSDVACDIDGMHQLFPVVVARSGAQPDVDVRVPPGLLRQQLGSLDLLREIDCSEIVDDLKRASVPAPHTPADQLQSLRTFMEWTSSLQHKSLTERYFGGVSKACKSCQFRADAGDSKRSGLHECMQEAVAKGMLDGPIGVIDRGVPLVTDIWGSASGGKSIPGELLAKRRLFLRDVQPGDLDGKRGVSATAAFTPLERRLAQVKAVQQPECRFELREDRLEEMDAWAWPLHMIDFETSAPAIPFFKEMRPYETIAFQFSHHIMEKGADGIVRIRHASQWICTEPNVFPSISFVRQLKRSLMPNGTLNGTVFRYHNHENTVLRNVRSLLEQSSEDDRTDLIAFIDRITVPTKKERGLTEHHDARAMVDLHKLVQEGYYSAHAGGSISLKYVLPAILNDAAGVRDLYSRPGIYGCDLPIRSLNFDRPEGHIWLKPDANWDPYRTLPPIFGDSHGDLDERLSRLLDEDADDGVIKHGGAAMTAYNYTQFAQLPASDRERVTSALLRYCELDTLAMVMVVQGLMELRKKPFRIFC